MFKPGYALTYQSIPNFHPILSRKGKWSNDPDNALLVPVSLNSDILYKIVLAI